MFLANKVQNRYVIGITGGIGSGKSTMANHLVARGCFVVDADTVAREAAMPGEPALDAVFKEFGSGVMRDDGTLDRQKLAEIAFADDEKLEKLNLIFHGDVQKRMINAIEKSEEPLIFLDVPLLYETGMDSLCDEVWLLIASEHARIERTMTRDHVTEDLVRARMESQMPDDEKVARGPIVISNDGTPEQLYMQIDKLIEALSVGTVSHNRS